MSVAASSFDMKVTNPKAFLDELDLDGLREILGRSSNGTTGNGPTYVEPNGNPVSSSSEDETRLSQEHRQPTTEPNQPGSDVDKSSESTDIIRGKIQRLGDFIDTDAVRTCHPFGTSLLTNSSSLPQLLFSSARQMKNSGTTVLNTLILNSGPVLRTASMSS